MKRNIASWAIAAVLVLSAVGVVKAQDSTTTQQQTTTTTTTTSDTNPTPSPDAMPTQNSGAMTPEGSAATQDEHSNVRTITGCLQKGEGANEYVLTGRDGSTWELRSDAVDLASHVGHTVTVTGAVRNAEMHGMKEDAKKEAQEHGMDKSATEHGHLTVTNVTHVSHSCS